jgi:tRNA threonylcarbamoyladenosine biosynthesis protein TsaB
MLVLAIDTSTSVSAVGWVEADAEIPRPDAARFARLVAPADPGHAETLIDRMSAALATGGHALADVGLLVFGRGPGTFTGLRIGLGTAKGLALSHGTPLVGISSLEALAFSAGVEGMIAPLIDARRGELYAALYEVRLDGGRPNARLAVPERVVRPDILEAALGLSSRADRVRFVGNGAIRYADTARALGELLPSSAAAPDPCRMALVGLERYRDRGGDDLAALEPSYLREPDAKLPAATPARSGPEFDRNSD